MEFLDIRDKNGNPTGEVKERSLVHADGDIHGTSHVWIVRKNEKGSYDLLLQKRSENKDAFPGCYDISSAGHLPAGQDYRCCILSSPYHDTTQLAFSSFTTPVILSQKMTCRSYITSCNGRWSGCCTLAGRTAVRRLEQP